LNIIPEVALVKLLLSYNNFKDYFRYINLIYLKDSFKELSHIYSCLQEWHLKFNKDASLEELQVFFYTSRPGVDDKQREIYDVIFQQISTVKTTEDQLRGLVQATARREQLQQLAVKSLEVAEGRADLAEIESLTKQLLEFTELSEKPATQFVSNDLNELYLDAVKTPGLRWRLASLNKSLGSLRKGDFGFIFARPETGKTTFLASEISFMATQLRDEDAAQNRGAILWFNNEEQGSKVMLRCYQASLGLRLEQLISSLKDNHQKFLKANGGRIKIYDQAIIDKEEVRRICIELQPSLIIFDQIDKLAGFKADRNDLELGEIYNWARELAKNFCPVIGVCQADGTGEGQKWLTMSNVANAKTSKQAEADWILGIGRSNDSGYEAVRHFNISKNKLIGDNDSRPEDRHAKWDVKIQPELARYEDFLNE